MIILGILIIILLVLVFGGISAIKQKEGNNMSLKKAYLYLVSVISLIIAVVGAIMLINLALKTWVFTKADRYVSYPVSCTAMPDGKNTNCDPATIEQQQKAEEQNRTSQRQQQAAQAIAMLVIATPVWWGHWRLARKEA